MVGVLVMLFSSIIEILKYITITICSIYKMKMTKISNINFSQKTVEKIEVSGDNIKEFKFEFHDNTSQITVMKNNNEVVEEVFEEQKVEEVVEQEVVIEEKVVEEPVNKKLTIADVKNIIYENILKKNTAETYFRDTM